MGAGQDFLDLLAGPGRVMRGGIAKGVGMLRGEDVPYQPMSGDEMLESFGMAPGAMRQGLGFATELADPLGAVLGAAGGIGASKAARWLRGVDKLAEARVPVQEALGAARVSRSESPLLNLMQGAAGGGGGNELESGVADYLSKLPGSKPYMPKAITKAADKRVAAEKILKSMGLAAEDHPDLMNMLPEATIHPDDLPISSKEYNQLVENNPGMWTRPLAALKDWHAQGKQITPESIPEAMAQWAAKGNTGKIPQYLIDRDLPPNIFRRGPQGNLLPMTNEEILENAERVAVKNTPVAMLRNAKLSKEAGPPVSDFAKSMDHYDRRLTESMRNMISKLEEKHGGKFPLYDDHGEIEELAFQGDATAKKYMKMLKDREIVDELTGGLSDAHSSAAEAMKYEVAPKYPDLTTRHKSLRDLTEVMYGRKSQAAAAENVKKEILSNYVLDQIGELDTTLTKKPSKRLTSLLRDHEFGLSNELDTFLPLGGESRGGTRTFNDHFPEADIGHRRWRVMTKGDKKFAWQQEKQTDAHQLAQKIGYVGDELNITPNIHTRENTADSRLRDVLFNDRATGQPIPEENLHSLIYDTRVGRVRPYKIKPLDGGKYAVIGSNPASDSTYEGVRGTFNSAEEAQKFAVKQWEEAAKKQQIPRDLPVSHGRFTGFAVREAIQDAMKNKLHGVAIPSAEVMLRDSAGWGSVHTGPEAERVRAGLQKHVQEMIAEYKKYLPNSKFTVENMDFDAPLDINAQSRDLAGQPITFIEFSPRDIRSHMRKGMYVENYLPPLAAALGAGAAGAANKYYQNQES